MKYDVGEYNVVLDIPTDNFVFSLFTAFHTQYMWDYIPTIETQIKNEKTLIILFGAFENLHEYDHWVIPINELKRKYNTPIIVFNGRLTSDNRLTVSPEFEYHKICFFDHISNINCFEKIQAEEVIAATKKLHKFYWASSKDLYTRRYILANLLDNDLVRDNLVNYKCIISEIPSDFITERVTDEYRKFINDKCHSIQDKVPLPSLDETIEFNLTNKNFYNNSYLGIITDTFFADYGGPSGIFFSEKVFHAINHHQMFFYIGPPYSLQYLKNLGYNIFDDVIDVSYDQIENHGERLIKATQSLINFLNKPLNEIEIIYQNNAKKIRENKILLRNQFKHQEIYNLLVETLNNG